MKNTYRKINALKANFDHLYCVDDPRSYYAVLGKLNYRIPELARPIISKLLKACQRIRKKRLTILDVGCSYGINAAIHRHPISLDALRMRYLSKSMNSISASEVALLDTCFFERQPDISVGDFIGLDRCKPAVDYALTVKLLRHGIVADLELETLSPGHVQLLQGIDVIIATGAIGYVTKETYRKLLNAIPNPPWVISFVLRIFPYEPISEVLSKEGLVTEKLAGVIFAQRNCQDSREREWSIQTLRSRGIDSSGYESEGLLSAELFVSRPKKDFETVSLLGILL